VESMGSVVGGGVYGSNACLCKVILKDESNSCILFKMIGLTFALYSSFHTGFACTPKRIPADKFEIFGRVIHFLPLHVCDDDIYVVAAVVLVMHPAKEHQFG
jgi:hypothetical protein